MSEPEATEDWQKLSYRVAIEKALGLEEDPTNHDPAWALETVREIREIGNGVLEKVFADRVGVAPERIPARFKLEHEREGVTQEFKFYPEEGKNEVEKTLAARTVALLEKLDEMVDEDHIDNRSDALRKEQDGLLSFAKAVLERQEEGLTLFVTTGEWADGRLGEVFIRAGKVGSKSRGYLDAICALMSVGLQFGIPLRVFVEKFERVRFPPDGPVEGHPERELRRCSSPLDLIVRWLARVYDPETGLRRTE